LQTPTNALYGCTLQVPEARGFPCPPPHTRADRPTAGLARLPRTGRHRRVHQVGRALLPEPVGGRGEAFVVTRVVDRRQLGELRDHDLRLRLGHRIDRRLTVEDVATLGALLGRFNRLGEAREAQADS